ncbi:MAG TPA: hypothetical protein PK926_00695 [Spirochaetota bacterium]|nr:hypothetical protein [Spirochaetota bacterium]HPI87868.1 hypothetical protein [Spirochaetota bacterium]HPR47400.1 hypothetical protein [Spirochaetota bacterium]
MPFLPERKSLLIRPVLIIILAAAFIFGFADIFIPLNFERLHIFLFNMTAGGFVILHYTDGGREPAPRHFAYLLLSVLYAVLAFMHWYVPAAAVSVPLWAIVERARVRRFSFFPWSFFSGRISVSRKFHEASLLCLSLAFVFSTAVLLNNEYFHWFHYEKLTLDVFFLGFSFPVSLITMSVMFHFIDEQKTVFFAFIANALFWTINLGVIIFFVFIIYQVFAGEVAVASVLFLAVMTLFVFFLRHGRALQQKHFLVSGMTFLLFTAVTGLLYVPVKSMYGGSPLASGLLLKAHSYISLYGWNLSGLFVILRWNDFPMRLNSRALILFHWAVILMAPLGKFFHHAVPFLSGAYMVLLYLFFFARHER